VPPPPPIEARQAQLQSFHDAHRRAPAPSLAPLRSYTPTKLHNPLQPPLPASLVNSSKLSSRPLGAILKPSLSSHELAAPSSLQQMAPAADSFPPSRKHGAQRGSIARSPSAAAILESLPSRHVLPKQTPPLLSGQVRSPSRASNAARQSWSTAGQDSVFGGNVNGAYKASYARAQRFMRRATPPSSLPPGFSSASPRLCMSNSYSCAPAANRSEGSAT